MSMSREEYKEFTDFEVGVERKMERIKEQLCRLEERIQDNMRAYEELKMKVESITDGEKHIIHSFDNKEEKT